MATTKTTSNRNSRLQHAGPYLALGVLIVLLAIGTTWRGVSINRQYAALAQCNSETSQQAVTALKARDESIIQINNAARKIAVIRHDLLLISLTGGDNPGQYTPLVADYNNSLTEYLDALDRYRDVSHIVPLPPPCAEVNR